MFGSYPVLWPTGWRFYMTAAILMFTSRKGLWRTHQPANRAKTCYRGVNKVTSTGSTVHVTQWDLGGSGSCPEVPPRCALGRYPQVGAVSRPRPFGSDLRYHRLGLYSSDWALKGARGADDLWRG